MFDIKCFNCGTVIAEAEQFDGEKEAMRDYVDANSVTWEFYRGEDGWEDETVCLNCEVNARTAYAAPTVAQDQSVPAWWAGN